MAGAFPFSSASPGAGSEADVCGGVGGSAGMLRLLVDSGAAPAQPARARALETATANNSLTADGPSRSGRWLVFGGVPACRRRSTVLTVNGPTLLPQPGKAKAPGFPGAFSGGSDRRRSGDLSIFSRTLYQLSYRALQPSCDDHRRRSDCSGVSATLTGLEPATSAVTGRRANQLRYRALRFCKSFILPAPLQCLEPLLRTPNGIRTRAAAVKGRCPRPLDDGGLDHTSALLLVVDL